MKSISNWGAFHRHHSAFLVSVLLLADLILTVIFALNQSIDIPTNHLDGAYQTASGLYRLADGQWPGKDFFPYLGVGLLYFLYPIYLLAGSNVAASVFTAYFAVAITCAFSVGFIGTLISKSNRLLVGVILGSLFLCLSVWLYPKLPATLIEHFTPGYSLRPLRAFLPYLCAAIVYVLLNSRLNPLIVYGGIGGLAGIALLWSNDYGIPTAGLLILFGFLWAYRSDNLSVKVVFVILGVALLVSFVSLLLATRGHGLDLLRYNFSDVANDQYWYFCCWSAADKVLSVTDFFTKFVVVYIGWWGLVLFGMAVLTYFVPTIEYTLMLFIGITLAAGGTLASVGGHLESGYMISFIFWCKATLGISLVVFILSAIARMKLGTSLLNSIVIPIILGSVIIQLLLISENVEAYVRKREVAQSDENKFFVPEMGGYLPNSWKAHVSLARDSNETTIVEEYWGIWSSISKTQTNFPVDSVIHALGDTRIQYAKILQKLPNFVVTSTPSISGPWYGWNLSANWWFYKIVLENYVPTQTSPSTLLWKKAAKRSIWPVTYCYISNDPKNPEIVIETNIPGYYEITIQYEVSELSSRTLLFVKNNLNLAFNGYLSLDPRAKTSTFPVGLHGSDENRLDFKLTTVSDDLSKVLVQGCQAKKIIFDFEHIGVPSLLIADPADTAFNLTDQNWVNGVARNWAGFFVRNTMKNRNSLTPGKAIKFAGDHSRSITRQEDGGYFLNIFLNGNPLDGNILGFPHKFEIQE